MVYEHGCVCLMCMLTIVITLHRGHRVPCLVTVLLILLKQVLALTLQLGCSQQAPASFCVPPPSLWSYRHAQPGLICSGVLGIGTQVLMLVQLFLPTGLFLSLVPETFFSFLFSYLIDRIGDDLGHSSFEVS